MQPIKIRIKTAGLGSSHIFPTFTAMNDKIRNSAEWMAALDRAVKPGKAEVLSRFFKTGKGEYGEGDTFIGVMVPDNRKVAKLAADAPLEEVEKMLRSGVHEHRGSALLSLVERFKKHKKDSEARKQIVDFYLSHTSGINNWDLVDLSAPYIIGLQMADVDGFDPTAAMLKSANIWEQRIAVVATMTLIRKGRFAEALRNVETLLHHDHDLLQKANGWMLREIGKRDEPTLTAFLDRHAATMPRTTLRYAIERLGAEQKKAYMSKKKHSANSL